MKALTIQQPWAGLLVLGIKQFETRNWNTKHRGTLVIHSSAKMTTEGKELLEWLKKDNRDKFFEGSRELTVCTDLGKVIGQVEVVDTVSSNEASGIANTEKMLGDFGPDRWLWKCENPIVYILPVPAVGKLSIWNWEPEAINQNQV